MTDEHDGSVRNHGDAVKQVDELLGLRPIVFATGEDVGGRGNADHFRLDVAGGLQELCIARRRLNLAAAARAREYGIVAEQ